MKKCIIQPGLICLQVDAGGKRGKAFAVETQPDGRNAVNVPPAFGLILADAGRGGERKAGQKGEVKRKGFSCGVQPGFLTAAAKADGTGALGGKGNGPGHGQNLSSFFFTGNHMRLSFELLSNATRLNISRIRLRIRLPYFSSSSEAERLVVTWVGMPLFMNRS